MQPAMLCGVGPRRSMKTVQALPPSLLATASPAGSSTLPPFLSCRCLLLSSFCRQVRLALHSQTRDSPPGPRSLQDGNLPWCCPGNILLQWCVGCSDEGLTTELAAPGRQRPWLFLITTLVPRAGHSVASRQHPTSPDSDPQDVPSSLVPWAPFLGERPQCPSGTRVRGLAIP